MLSIRDLQRRCKFLAQQNATIKDLNDFPVGNKRIQITALVTIYTWYVTIVSAVLSLLLIVFQYIFPIHPQGDFSHAHTDGLETFHFNSRAKHKFFHSYFLNSKVRLM